MTNPRDFITDIADIPTAEGVLAVRAQFHVDDHGAEYRFVLLDDQAIAIERAPDVISAINAAVGALNDA